MKEIKVAYHLLGLFGFLALAYGFFSTIFFSNMNGYIYFVIGGTFFFAYLNLILGNESLFAAWERDWKVVLKAFVVYVVAGVFIEYLGLVAMRLWYYPTLDKSQLVWQVFLVTYPFVFQFLLEFFRLCMKYMREFAAAVIFTTIINALWHEVPNTLVWRWIYTVPYVTLELFNVNLVVIFGWAILVAVPLISERLIHEVHTKHNAKNNQK